MLRLMHLLLQPRFALAQHSAPTCRGPRLPTPHASHGCATPFGCPRASRGPSPQSLPRPYQSLPLPSLPASPPAPLVSPPLPLSSPPAPTCPPGHLDSPSAPDHLSRPSAPYPTHTRLAPHASPCLLFNSDRAQLPFCVKAQP